MSRSSASAKRPGPVTRMTPETSSAIARRPPDSKSVMFRNHAGKADSVGYRTGDDRRACRDCAAPSGAHIPAPEKAIRLVDRDRQNLCMKRRINRKPRAQSLLCEQDGARALDDQQRHDQRPRANAVEESPVSPPQRRHDQPDHDRVRCAVERHPIQRRQRAGWPEQRRGEQHRPPQSHHLCPEVRPTRYVRRGTVFAVRVLRVITRLNIGGPSIQAITLSDRLAARGFETRARARPPRSRRRRHALSAARHRLRRKPLRDAAARRSRRCTTRSRSSQLRATSCATCARHRAHAHGQGRHARPRRRPRSTTGRPAATLRARVVHTYHGHVLEGYFSPARRRACSSASNARSRASPIASSPSRRASGPSCSTNTASAGPISTASCRSASISTASRRSTTTPERARACDARICRPTARVVTTVGRLTAIKQHGFFSTPRSGLRSANPSRRLPRRRRRRAARRARGRGVGARHRRSRALSRLATRSGHDLRRHRRVPADVAQRRHAGRADREHGRRLRRRQHRRRRRGRRHRRATRSACWRPSATRARSPATSIGAAARSAIGDGAWAPPAGARPGALRARPARRRHRRAVPRAAALEFRAMPLRRSLLDRLPCRRRCTACSSSGISSPTGRTQWTDQDGYRRLGAGPRDDRQIHALPGRADVRAGSHSHAGAIRCSSRCIYRLFGVAPAGGRARADARVRVHLPAGLRDRAAHHVGPDRASARRLLTALFPPIPYFGALVMTEVLDDAAVHALDVAGASRRSMIGAMRDFAWLGVLLGADDAEPAGLRAVSVRAGGTGRSWCFRSSASTPRPRLAQWAAMLAAFALTMAAVVHLQLRHPRPLHALARRRRRPRPVGRLVAGDVVRPRAERADPSRRRHRRPRRRSIAASPSVAAREQLPAGPMLEYVHQWEDIRRIWTEPTDPLERAVARVEADEEYQRVGIENISARCTGASDQAARARRCSCCGRRRFRFATATSTRCRPWPSVLLGGPGDASLALALVGGFASVPRTDAGRGRCCWRADRLHHRRASCRC